MYLNLFKKSFLKEKKFFSTSNISNFNNIIYKNFLNKNANKIKFSSNFFNQVTSNLSNKINNSLITKQLKNFSDLNLANHVDVNQLNVNKNENQLTGEEVMKAIDPEKIRNIAIIAHVDHGKTTLVDCMLSQGGIDIVGNERAMDNNELEQERGITILSKCTAISYQGHKINIVDTPGHQDFGGEVERIMSMVDSVCLVVCASEGPMPQTRYVLQKALARGLKPIVVINKVDRDLSRLVEVENEIFELFISLDANEEQMNYPLLYTSAKSGWCSIDKPTKQNQKPNDNIFPLLNSIIEYVPKPDVNLNDKFSMLITQIESSNFFGKMLIGRIESGQVALGDKVSAFDQEGNNVENAKVFKIIRRFGTKQMELQKAGAGDIILLSGFTEATVSHTVNSIGNKDIIKVNLIFIYFYSFNKLKTFRALQLTHQ